MFESILNVSSGGYSGWLLVLLIVVAIWKLLWYGLALYKALEKKQKPWFVILFIAAFVLNDLGILAIIYLIIMQSNSKKRKKK